MSKKAKKKGAKRHLKSVKTKTKGPAKPAKKATKAAASTAVRDRAVELIQFARKTINKYMGGFSAEQLTAQPGGLANHVLWTQGHLAATAAWALSLLSGETGAVPENYEKLFGMGSTPTSDPATYPPAAEVKGYFDSTYEKLLAAVTKMNDAQLAAPVEASGFARDKADLLAKVAWHEGWHVGQVTDLRRLLGLGSP